MRFLPFYIHLPLMAIFIYSLFYGLRYNFFFTIRVDKQYNILLKKISLLLSVASILGMLSLYVFPRLIQTETGYQFVFSLILTYCFFWIPNCIFSFFIFVKAKLKNKGQKLLHTGRFFSFLFIGLILYGVLWEKHNYEIIRTEIHLKNLPQSFDGFKIVQISDFHLGSLNKDTSEVNKIVGEINRLNPDLICFTGDLVNCRAEEIRPFITNLKRLKSTYGNFSVLGNHDFGEFYPWKNKDELDANDSLILALQAQAGFKVLQDEFINLKIGKDSLALIGIQNWSKPPFPSKGNFEKASKGTEGFGFRMLLSHDPTHWQLKISGKQKIDLTLSGHTHGGQVGFRWNNKKYSPATFKFPFCGGLYTNGDQYLYVNVGLGYVGLPARIGMRPEISLLTLRHHLK